MKTTSLLACFVIAMLVTAHASDMCLVSGGGQPQGPQYDFYIGKYETTCEEFCEFLNDAQSNIGNERGANMYFEYTGNVYMNPEMSLPLFGITSSSLQYDWRGEIGKRYTVTTNHLDHPITSVSWYGALKYCNWLTVMTKNRGIGQRCYTEGSTYANWHPANLSDAEWADGFQDAERLAWVTNYIGFRLPMDDITAQANDYNEFYKAAAWSGSANMSYSYGRNTIDPADANLNFGVSGAPFTSTTPVGYYDGSNHGGTFQTRSNANFYGVYDLSGNVAEWMTDMWGQEGYTNYADNYGNLRGGSWSDDSGLGASSAQDPDPALGYFFPASTCSADLGFRVVSALPGSPAAPQNVQGSDGTYSDKVKVTWDAVMSATGYEVWRHTTNNATAAILIGTTTTNTYDDTGAVIETIYYYWVKSTNSAGSSGFSSYGSGWRAQTGRTTRMKYNDFDGDGASDIAVYNKANGAWRIASVQRWCILLWDVIWGGPEYRPINGDYDGDKTTDVAVYNEKRGLWSIASLSRRAVIIPSASFGGPNLTPVSGDYDGDGIYDGALCQSPDGFWYVVTSTGTTPIWGKTLTGGGFVPVSGDYDRDFISDLAMYSPSSGYWYIMAMTGKAITWGTFWGVADATPVSGDYDGDGYSDLTVYQESTGMWYIWSLKRSALIASGGFGGPGFLPVPGDYDGDGYSDPAVYQESTGLWYIWSLKRSVSIANALYFGGPGYIPVLPAW